MAQPRGAGHPAGRQVTQNPEPEPEPVPMRQVALEGGHGLGGGPGAQRRRHLRVAVHPPQHREVGVDQPLGVKPAEGEGGRRRLELDRVGRPEERWSHPSRHSYGDSLGAPAEVGQIRAVFDEDHVPAQLAHNPEVLVQV